MVFTKSVTRIESFSVITAEYAAHEYGHRHPATAEQPAQHHPHSMPHIVFRARCGDADLPTRLARQSSGVRISLQPLQIGPHFGCTLVAQVAVFLQQLIDNFFQLAGTSGFSRTAQPAGGSESHRK